MVPKGIKPIVQARRERFAEKICIITRVKTLSYTHQMHIPLAEGAYSHIKNRTLPAEAKRVSKRNERDDKKGNE